MIAVYILLGLLVLLGLLYVLCLRCRRRKDWERFRKWRFAHRGFHDKPRIPENSLPAFRRAEERTRELYHVANTYTEDALRRTEEAIQMALSEVQESRVRFRAASQEQMQAQRAELNRTSAAEESPKAPEDAQ